MAERVSTVGAVISQLVVATYLARAGESVALYELRDEVGDACI